MNWVAVFTGVLAVFTAVYTGVTIVLLKQSRDAFRFDAIARLIGVLWDCIRETYYRRGKVDKSSAILGMSFINGMIPACAEIDKKLADGPDKIGLGVQ